MILIADTGSTKAAWAAVDETGQFTQLETAGFNPYFTPGETIEEIIEKELYPYIRTDLLKSVYFYGAGCSTISKCTIVEDALKRVFGDVEVEVQHDILGAARALFGKGQGIACILGTGANSCDYNGASVNTPVASLGYIYGDEGSGAYLGKLFITELLQGKAPVNIKEEFDKRYGYSLENILDATYNKPHPNRFLASFAIFLAKHRQDPYIHSLIERNFEDFFKERLTRHKNYDTLPIGVVGSIGFYFKEELSEIAEKHHVNISRVMKAPIEGLVEYHKEV